MCIQTEDLGIAHGDGFEILGRASGAEVRGCSLNAEALRTMWGNRLGCPQKRATGRSPYDEMSTTIEQIHQAAIRVCEARGQLQRRSTDAIIGALAQTARSWLEPKSVATARQQASSIS